MLCSMLEEVLIIEKFEYLSKLCAITVDVVVNHVKHFIFAQ